MAANLSRQAHRVLIASILIAMLTAIVTLSGMDYGRLWRQESPDFALLASADHERILQAPFHGHPNAAGRVFLTYGR